MKTIIVIGLALGVLILAPFALFSASDNYNYCAANNGRLSQSSEELHRQNSNSPITNPTFSRLLFHCAGAYAHENADAITAIATVVGTLVAILLGWLALGQEFHNMVQSRAYLSVSAPHFGSQNPTTFTVEVENAGQTPAYQVKAHVNRHWTASAGEGLPKNFTFPNYNVVPSSTPVIAPGKPRSFTFQFDPAELDKVRNGQADLFFYGRIDYVDVFKKKRTTQLCYQYFAGQHSHQLEMMPIHNDAT